MNKFTKKFLTNDLNMNENDTKLVMEAQRKFPSILVDDGEGFCVNARTLWKELDVRDMFANWIKINLKNIGSEEGTDYRKFDFALNQNQNTRGGNRKAIEYKLTLEIAKQIAMITGANPRANKTLKENSRLVRTYFIRLERAIKEGIEWERIRFPQKQGFKEMCKIIDTNYLDNHSNCNKTPRYAFTNEADMLNMALFRCKAKKMRTILEVEQKDTIRDNLQLECNKALLELQILNGSLILNNITYKARKVMIENTCKSKFADLRNRFNEVFAKDIAA